MARLAESAMTAFLLIACLAMSSQVAAQCEFAWETVPVSPFPEDEEIQDAAGTAWDPDGDGPAGTSFVFAVKEGNGGFGFAIWDGEHWSPVVHTPLEDVSKFTIHNGRVIVGGYRHISGGNYAGGVWLFDGAALHPMGEMTTTRNVLPATYRGELIAAGYFGGLARWTGSAWAPLGSVQLVVRDLVQFRDDLIVAGTAAWGEVVMAWNGDSWRPIVDGAYVSGLTVAGDRLIAGGLFESIGGAVA